MIPAHIRGNQTSRAQYLNDMHEMMDCCVAVLAVLHRKLTTSEIELIMPYIEVDEVSVVVYLKI
jgi:hypothetical protein